MSTVSLQIADQKTVYFQGSTYSYKDMIKAIPGSAWSKKNKRWELPIESVADARRIFPSLHMAPEVVSGFQALKERQDKAVALKSIDESKVDGKVKGLKGTLRPYQAVGKAFLNTLEEGEGAILGFDMGLGKSLTGLAYGLELVNQKKIDHILIVCPAPLKYATWEKEVLKWTSIEDYVVIDGDKREVVEWDDGTKEKLTGQKLREVQYQQASFGCKVMITNYELFLRDIDIMPVIDNRWLVILDEAHRIKNPKAQTTKNLMKKLKPAGRKVLGTGTPLENNIQELWTLVDFCRPNLLGNYYKFVERYCEVNYFGSIVAPKPQMMGELQGKIAPILLRKTKEEALPDLPPLTVEPYWVEMTKVQKDLYKQVKEGILQNAKTMEFSYLEVLSQLTRCQQVCDSPALLKKVLEDDSLPEESGKLNELKNLFSEINPQRNKVILFSQYVEMTDILYQWLLTEGGLRKEQIGYVKGGLKPSETGRIQNEFQTGGIQVVLMTTAGNYGLDLSAGQYVVCYDELFNPQKMNQIYSRAHRSGVQNPVIAYNLRTRGTYEEKKAEILERKKELFKAVIDEDAEVFEKLFDSPRALLDLL